MSETNMPGPKTLLLRLAVFWRGSGPSNPVSGPNFSETELDRLREHFDEEYYVGKNTDVDFSGTDPLLHFLEFGRTQVRDPHPGFSIVDYLEMYPDIRNSDINPLVHFVQHGKREGRRTKKGANFVQDARCRRSDIEKLSGFFDEEFYLTRYPGHNLDGMAPIEHYIKQGEQRGRRPNCHFDPKYYRQRVNGYAENLAIHYLEQGQKAGIPGSWCDVGDADFEHVCEAIGMEPAAVVTNLKQTYRDRRDRFSYGELGEMMEKAVKLDPLIALGRRQHVDQFGVPPIRNQASTSFVSAMYQLQKLAGWRRAKIVVLVSCIQQDDGGRMTGHLLEAICTFADPEDIVVLNTESSAYEHMDRLPVGCRYIDFSVFRENIDAEKQARLLFEFLRSLVPGHIMNVDSALFWDVAETFGRQLNDVTSLGCYLLGDENDSSGNEFGYLASRFRVYQELIDVFITDSQTLTIELAERFSLPEAVRKKLFHLETPVRQTADTSNTEVNADRLTEPNIKKHGFDSYAAKVREIIEVPHA